MIFSRLHGLYERQRRRDHGIRRLPKSAFADHRIFGVGVNIEHGREVEVDAERGEFAAHRAANFGGLPRPSRGIGEARDGRAASGTRGPPSWSMAMNMRARPVAARISAISRAWLSSQVL